MLSSSICIDPSSTNSWNPSGKIAEYMTCGKCVITTNTYTHRFFIEDDINGLLFEANNVDDLIKKMDLSLGDSKYREKLGNQARATSEERFDVKQIAPIFEVFLKERIDEHSILNKPKKSDRR
jgi:glycosyltransferase involved in cell wall biosynthesis